MVSTADFGSASLDSNSGSPTKNENNLKQRYYNIYFINYKIKQQKNEEYY